MSTKEDSDKIEVVLREVMFDDEDVEEGDLLVEWLVIGYVANPDDEKGSAYPMLFSNGSMPTHVVRGLLHTALKFLEED